MTRKDTKNIGCISAPNSWADSLRKNITLLSPVKFTFLSQLSKSYLLINNGEIPQRIFLHYAIIRRASGSSRQTGPNSLIKGILATLKGLSSLSCNSQPWWCLYTSRRMFPCSHISTRPRCQGTTALSHDLLSLSRPIPANEGRSINGSKSLLYYLGTSLKWRNHTYRKSLPSALLWQEGPDFHSCLSIPLFPFIKI